MRFTDYYNKDNKKSFFTYVETQSGNPIEMNFMEIFYINISKIPKSGKAIYSEDSPKELKALLSDISWGIRTYINYQDIFSTDILSPTTSFKDNPELHMRQLVNLNKDYCYYESLHYLEEIVSCILHGNLLASLVLLRPFIELSIANIFWSMKSKTESSENYYKWILGNINYKKVI